MGALCRYLAQSRVRAPHPAALSTLRLANYARRQLVLVQREAPFAEARRLRYSKSSMSRRVGSSAGMVHDRVAAAFGEVSATRYPQSDGTVDGVCDWSGRRRSGRSTTAGCTRRHCRSRASTGWHVTPRPVPAPEPDLASAQHPLEAFLQVASAKSRACAGAAARRVRGFRRA